MRTKNFLNFFWGWNFWIFLILCAFWTISRYFVFWKFWKIDFFKILPIRTLPQTVCLTLSLPDSVSAGLGLFMIWSLYDPVSAKTKSNRHRVIQRPSPTETRWGSDRVWQRPGEAVPESDRDGVRQTQNPAETGWCSDRVRQRQE